MCRYVNVRPLVTLLLLLLLVGHTYGASAVAAEGEPIRVLIDTDLGGTTDDAFALALAIADAKLELRGITTAGGQAEDRAWMVCRLLSQVEQDHIPVAFGREPQAEGAVGAMIQYRRHPSVVWNRTSRPAKEPAAEFLYQKLQSAAGKATIVCLGPLTNVARMLEQHADAREHVQRIVLVAGSLADAGSTKAELSGPDNLRRDVPAAKAVFAAGIPLTVIPAAATSSLRLQPQEQLALFAACTPLTYQLQALSQLAEGEATLRGTAALAAVLGKDFVELEERRLAVTDAGNLQLHEGEPNVSLLTNLDRKRWHHWVATTLTSYGEQALPEPPQNESQLVERGGLPVRVHAFEDYETDIERRWWLTGKLELHDVPPGSNRACRAVLTQDYDAKMGNLKTSYAAVVFNPVPGPPMGKHPQLTFRYKLLGTDTLRVQLFSLSNGYHRYLSLKGLPQGSWQTATVDMRAMRRPDGSGGPLAEDERIDDIQFYIDPRAELLIDDVVLYEAAPAEETRPFPQRILFTGWFDTGKQGNEWPGKFEIVLHEPPRTWDAAQAITNETTGRPELQIGLRGPRPLDRHVRLRFRYLLSGGNSIEAALLHSQSDAIYTAKATNLANGQWEEVTLDFDIPAPHSNGSVDTIRLVGEKGAKLLIDDLLLYVPGPQSPARPNAER